jgi:hypothetical protein
MANSTGFPYPGGRFERAVADVTEAYLPIIFKRIAKTKPNTHAPAPRIPLISRESGNPMPIRPPIPFSIVGSVIAQTIHTGRKATMKMNVPHAVAKEVAV